MDPYNQNNPQYQTGGYANYQGPQGEPMIASQPGYSPQPQYAAQPQFAAQPQPVIQNNEVPAFKDDIQTEANINYIMRRGFIVKTYGILLSQLALSTAFIALTFIPAIKKALVFNIDNNPLVLVFLIIFLVVTIVVFSVFGCCRETARKVPTNYILLFSFTLCMSFYLSLLCSLYETKDVISALILTCAATVGLTIYASRTTTDFTYCGGFLFAFVLILIISFALFFWVRYFIFYCAVGVLIYSLYLIYDTQLILGKFGNEYNIDDYCFAALNLYIDIIYIFIRILAILGNAKK